MPRTEPVASGHEVRAKASGPRAKVRVFLVDDHHLFLSGARAELGDAVEVVGDADEVGAAIELIAERLPDVVLVDVHMPEGGGQAVIEAIGRTHPEVRFLALSVSDAAEDVIGVIGRGGDGCATKTISGAELTDAVERVAEGDAVFYHDWPVSSSTPSPLIPARRGGGPVLPPELDQLTPLKREVLRLIARGDAYKKAARELSISVKTVESHVSAVLRKLQLSSRHQLTRWATERRLL